MVRLNRNKSKVQKIDAENIPPPETLSNNRRAKVGTKSSQNNSVNITQTNLISRSRACKRALKSTSDSVSNVKKGDKAKEIDILKEKSTKNVLKDNVPKTQKVETKSISEGRVCKNVPLSTIESVSKLRMKVEGNLTSETIPVSEITTSPSILKENVLKNSTTIESKAITKRKVCVSSTKTLNKSASKENFNNDEETAIKTIHEKVKEPEVIPTLSNLKENVIVSTTKAVTRAVSKKNACNNLIKTSNKVASKENVNKNKETATKSTPLQDVAKKHDNIVMEKKTKRKPLKKLVKTGNKSFTEEKLSEISGKNEFDLDSTDKAGNNLEKSVSNSKADQGPSVINDKLVSGMNKIKPVYLSQKRSLTRRSTKELEERLHLYDFEVDENEPVAKKGKRKPILKIKKPRPYRKKKIVLPQKLLILEEVEKENVNPIPTTSHTPSKKALSPLAELSNIPIEDNLNLSLGMAVPPVRHTLYSPQPYRSPRKESLNVPVLRTSDCGNNSSGQSCRSLNVSACSDAPNQTGHSTFGNNFMNQLFIGSSTPIRHWTEESVRPYFTPMRSPPNDNNQNFDLSNNFGFEAEVADEPFVSPIKYFVPTKTPVKQKSPVKIPFKRVIKLLKFGYEAADSDGDVSFDGLPEDFFHDGDSICTKMIPPSPMCDKVRAKENLNDSGNATQSSEDKESQDKFDFVYKNKRKNSTTIKEIDNGYEMEFKTPAPTIKNPRRSYERPAYLRTKKKAGPLGVIEVEEEEQIDETVDKKPTKKKAGGLSKKDELEMEKWAKAFNEQCMQVDSYDLCVE